MKYFASLLLALVLTLSPALAATGPATFSDVPADAWYAPYVEVCVEAGLMEGTGNGKFEPDGEITIESALALSARLLHVLKGGDGHVPAAGTGRTVEFLDEGGEPAASYEEFVSISNWGKLDETEGDWDKMDELPPSDGYDVFLTFTPEATRRLDDAVLRLVFDGQTSFRGEPAVNAKGEVGWRFAVSEEEFYAGDPFERMIEFRNQSQEQAAWYWPELAYLASEKPGLDRLELVHQPGEPANRAELLALLALATDELPLLPLNQIEALPDSNDPDVLRFYNAGILSGVDDRGTFAGDRTLTRAETATILARVLEPELRLRPAVEPRDAEELTALTVSHLAFGRVDTEYTLDFAAHTATKWTSGYFQGANAPDQAETVELDPGAVAVFQQSQGMDALLGWSGMYIDPNVMDGHQWAMTLAFSDGTQRELSGSNSYPQGWDELYGDLLALTGWPVLDVYSDWIEQF